MEVYVLLKCPLGTEKEIISNLKKLPEVIEINGIWGKYDIIVKVSSPEPDTMDSIISKIRSTKNITSTESMPVLYGQGGSIDE